MHDIHMAKVSDEFARCWKAAGIHIQNQAQGDLQSWLRAHLNPPFLEHLSFRLGNQLFFIQLQDVDDVLEMPGNLGGLLSIADSCKGHACLMPMQKIAGEWRCVATGWGLIDARTERSVNPVALITDESIEMTDWELQDFAVQVVRSQLEKDGRQLMSWQGNPSVDPSIWFVGDDGPEWIVVRATRWPKRDVEIPSNIADIAKGSAKLTNKGNFAVVRVANSNDPFDPMAEKFGNFLPLIRGQGLSVGYEGMQSLPPFEFALPEVPADIGRQLVTELIGWFENLIKSETLLPKVFTGVNAQGRQFIVVMGDLDLDNREHLDFMRYVLHKENSVAFAYKMRNAVEVCKEPQIIQEQHTFFSGQAGKYIAVDITSESPDSWAEGMKIIRRSSSEEPEVFLQDLMSRPYKPSGYDSKYAALWAGIREKIQWRDRDMKSSVDKKPIDFAMEVFANILPFPFQDSNLHSRELSERLELQDAASAAKFQVVCICIVLFLIKRAVREALVVKFGSNYKTLEDFNQIALAADSIANSIIEQQLKLFDFPSYVDLQYFLRWDRRYHEAAADASTPNLRQSILSCALRHATFTYEDEHAVATSDALMLVELSRIYDAYVNELRNMLGVKCLH